MRDKESARELLRRLVNAYNAKDRETLAELYDKEISLWSSLGEAATGRDDVLSHVGELFDALPDERMRANTVITDGDTIVVEFTSTGTNASNEPYELRFTEVFELKAGKFSEIRTYIDPDDVAAISH